jgi:lysozyme
MNIARLRERVKLDEGLRLKPYRCTAGKLTIGYGRNLEDNGISDEEAEYLLTNDLKFAAMETVAMFPTWDRLSDLRREVLVNMMLNLGATKLRKFKRMREALSREDYGSAAAEMLDSKWALQVGQRAERLAKQMRDDEEQSDG